MKKNSQSVRNNNITAGIILLTVGVFMLLERLDIFDITRLLTWPVIIIVVGVIILVRNRMNNGFGLFLVLLGSFFLLKREGWLPYGYETYVIPVALIILGIYFLLIRNMRSSNDDWALDQELSKRKDKFADDSDVLRAEALFGSVRRIMLSKNFKGGKVSSTFGSAFIDLSSVELQEDATLHFEVTFGGVKLFIPSDWELKTDVSNTFASVEDKRVFPPAGEATHKILKLTGSVTFGSLEIMSK
ncbi:hypothetical protein C9994_14210 [Marivirga lumbricoides]|uniref:LiaF transmembrane domain-containing protein n=1 Tax=Marivirga lumbricoides TaxID=1046115 RepID=A0A2T4DF45_9BACT|nr:hypothetical protein C9994_14210 [Marivirga lumbricoides]